MRLLIASCLASLLPCTGIGQTYTISTVAGSTPQTNVPGTSASLGGVVSVAADATGNLYFSAQDIVMRLAATTGVLTVVAGNGTEGFSGDNGPATSAQLFRPGGVAVDSAGNLYIADEGNNCIRKVSNGVITTVAGNGTAGFSGDNGPATSAELSSPTGVAVDSSGNLYIADNSNNRIRKVSNGTITTVAGNGTAGLSGDNGPATSAALNFPNGVAVDSSGSLYIADYGNNQIRKVSGGVITTVAGNGMSACCGDNGPATSAQLAGPDGVAVDSSGNIYIADTYNNRIRKVSGGVITTIAGDGTAGSSGDNGPATSAKLDYPLGIAVDSAGNAYLADYADSRIRKVSGGVITTVAGNTADGFSGDNGPATSAQLDVADGVAVDSSGDVYIADFWNNRVRKVSGGVITTVAGSATSGFRGDNGPAINAELTEPTGVALDSAGNLYIADAGNNRVRKVSNGVITTIAGNGTAGHSGDSGSATGAELDYPTCVAVDSAGNLYIGDTDNNRIRKVSNGVITTVAGNGTAGFSGDNGTATSAELNFPYGVAVDSAGDLYIADTYNNRIRKISGGVITTVAGNGTAGFSGDNGPATSAELDLPPGVAVDSAGNLYVAEYGNNRVRKVSNGAITTIAGNGTAGFSGDNGLAARAQLYEPFAVALDSAGDIYVGDENNNRVRLLTPSVSSSCTYALSPTPLQSPAAGGTFTIAIQTAAGCSWTISGLPTWITVSGASAGSGPASVTLIVAPNTSSAALNATVSIAGVSFTVTQAGAASAPTSVITSVGTASGGANIAQNTFIVIEGANLVPATTPAAGVIWSTAPSFASGQMPTQLDGVSVMVNGKPAYVYFYCSAATSQVCTSDQINVLTPLDNTTGPVPIVVTSTTSSGTTTTSPYTTTLTAVAPTFLLFGSTSYVAATHANNSLVGPTSLYPGASTPAQLGEEVVIYAVGFGLPATPLTAGSSTQSGVLPTLPVCSVANTGATVAFAGVISPGLYQLNITIPAGTPNGDQPISCTYDGAATPAGDLIAVGQ